MTPNEVTQLVNGILEPAIRQMQDEANAFRRWKPLDSVTDQFSPITGASQQIAFFGTGKIVQPTTTITGATFADSGATTVHTASTFDGYTIGQVVKALRNLGLLH